MLKRGEPPWHWAVFARVKDALENVCPSAPVMLAPADAFVVVAQFFTRCSTPPLYDDDGQPVVPGSKVHGVSAAAAVPASASAAVAAMRRITFFMRFPS